MSDRHVEVRNREFLASNGFTSKEGRLWNEAWDLSREYAIREVTENLRSAGVDDRLVKLVAENLPVVDTRPARGPKWRDPDSIKYAEDGYNDWGVRYHSKCGVCGSATPTNMLGMGTCLNCGSDLNPLKRR